MEYCSKCNEGYEGYNFCPYCGVQIKAKLKPKPFKEAYMNSYGYWRVTTEGDCEGRSTTHLGTFKGHIDEIAYSLASKVYYKLEFEKVDTNLLKPNTKVKEVHISFDIDSGTWDFTPEERAISVAEVLKDRPVKVEESNYYAGIKLVFND